ncbi:MAG TPA: outer membrane lipoprotein-sorting protein [Candidatus Bipolaricaulota bacterium]
MKRSMFSRFALMLAALAVAALMFVPRSQSQSLTSEQIMNASNDRDQGADFQSQLRLTGTDAQGNSSELTVDMIVKRTAGSLEAGKARYQVLATVTAPADSKDLAVLVHEQDFPTPDDIWLYLPAVGSAKKVVPENFRTSLFGSEFSLEELIDREPGLDAHQLLREESVNGRTAWVVKSTPLDPEVAGFAYRITWVDQESFLQLRMELYDDFDALIKVFVAEQLEVVDGIFTRVVSSAENLETGRKSTFQFIDPRYNQGNADDALFDPANLGKS